MSLLLYNFFHLNLAYSAIEEEDRPRVIEKCYWPLLRLARKRKLPFGIELSGYTLEAQVTIPMSFTCSPEELGHLLLSAAVMQEAFETIFGMDDPFEPVVHKLQGIMPQKFIMSATGYFSRFLVQD